MVAPTIDARHHALYIGTGDAYTGALRAKNTDAVMGLRYGNRKNFVGSVQDTEDDVWFAGCGTGSTVNTAGLSKNCPEPLGPDYDFGSSMILRTLPDGHRVLVAAQKSGMVWAHDPDHEGKLLMESATRR